MYHTRAKFKINRKKIVFVVIAITVFTIFGFETFLSSKASAVSDGINHTINFQGKLVNSNGTNVADGDYDIVFQIYSAASGGGAIWTESRTGGNQATVTGGIFQVALGSITALPGSVDFNTDSLYLGITVGADSEMTPRVRFTSVPQAFNAEMVNGLTVTNTTDAPFSATTTFKIADGKTVVINNGLTFSGTDGTTITFPNANDTAVVLDLAQTLTNKTVGSTGLIFSGAGDDITTVSNENFNIAPNGSGKIGFNNESPLASFDVRQNSVSGGTIAVASVSGATSFAALLVDNGGLGDIFTASTGGVPKFTIKNNGQLYSSSYTSNGGILFANTTGIIGQTAVGDSGQCLQSIGGGTPTWGSCGGGPGGSSNWVLSTSNGTLSPINNTLDVLFGGIATSSAKFAVLGMDGTGPATASVSGNMIVMPNNGAGGLLGIGLTNPAYNIDTTVVNGQRGLNVTGTTTTAGHSFYGNYNTLSYTGGSGSPGVIAGTRNDMSIAGANSTNSRVYGTYNSLTIGANANDAYGSYNTFNTGTFTSTNMYGYYNDFGTNTSTNQDGYGLYNLASPASSSISTKTGVYNKFDNIVISNGVRNVFTADQTSVVLKGLINDFTNTAAVNGIGYTGVENNFSSTRGGAYIGVDNAFTTTSSSSIIYGIKNVLAIGAGGSGGDIYGAYNQITNNGGSSGATAFGDYIQLTTTGSSTPKSYGLYVDDAAGTTTGTQYGAYFALNDTDATKNWAVYVEDASSNLYFGDNGIDWGLSGVADTSLIRGGAGQLNLTGRMLMTGGTTGGNAALIVNQNGAAGNDILTASASGVTKFVINNDGTASSSAGFTIDAAGSLQTTLNQTLTIGGNTTGDITVSPLNGNGTVTINGTLAAKTGRGATLTIAANDSSATAKAQADYVCGASDCDTTIETAITALPAGGGSIILLEGTYPIDSDGIDITKSNTSIIGSGKSTILQRGWDTGVNDGVITASSVSNIIISDLAIDGVKGTYAGAQNIGIFFSSSVTYTTIRNTYVHDNDGLGISLSTSSNNTITDNTVVSNDFDGIYIASSSNSNIITNNTVGSNGQPGITITSSYNTITNNTIQSNTDDGMLLSSADNSLVSGNYFYSNTASGIHLISTNNALITGNKLYNNGGSTYSSIWVVSSDNNTISSNDIVDTAGGSTFAIDVYSSACDNNYLVGNNFSGTGATKINDDGTGTVIQHRDRFAVSGTNPAGNLLNISGQSVGQSLFNLNYTGSGQDILTASAAGVTKFVINNDGTASSAAGFTIDGVGSLQSTNGQTLTIGGDTTGFISIDSGSGKVDILDNTSINGTLTGLTGLTLASGPITLGGVTGSGLCLTGGATASWGSCSGGPAGENWWNLDTLNGVLYPGNLTTDLLVGGSSSSSAAFKVTGQGNPFAGTLAAASVSANTSFAGLVVDNRGVGDLFAASYSGIPKFVIKNSGDIGIGTTVPTSQLGFNTRSQTGTGTISSTGMEITGASTAFSTQLHVGDTITLTSGAQAGETRTVISITDDDTMDVNTSFSVDQGAGKTFSFQQPFVKFASSTGTTLGLITSIGGTYLGDGTASAPAISFLNDDNTGFYRSGPDLISFVGNGQNTLNLDGSSGEGRIMVGNFAPVSRLQINDDSNDAASGITLGYTDTTYIQIFKSGSNKLAISGGFVGIGDSNTSPVARLDILDNATNINGQKLALRRTGAGDVGLSFQQNGTSAFGIVNRSGSGNGLAFVDNYYEGSNGTEIARFYASAGVGIGTMGVTPVGTLDVRGAFTNSGTQPTGIFTGTTSYAGIVVNNLGVGDLFTASSSSVAKFVITKNGTAKINSSETLTNGLLIENSTATTLTNAINILQTAGTITNAINANGTAISLAELQALDGGIETADIANGTIDADDLDQASADGAPGDEECLTYETSGGGDFEWQACGGAPGGVVVKVKTADEGRLNTATPTNDNTLTFSMGSAEDWVFQFNVDPTNTSTTPDIRYDITTGAATADYCRYMHNDVENATANSNIACTTITGFPLLASGADPIMIIGSVENSAGAAGTVALRWAQSTANSTTTTTLRRGSSMRAFKVQGADLAEYYNTKDISIEAGDIVSIDPDIPGGVGVKKTDGKYDKNVIGIVSTTPGLALADSSNNIEQGKLVPLGLAGRVPIKVSAENGRIMPGDYLTPSSIPGVAMKSTRAGPIVAQALVAYDAPDPNTVGRTIAFIKSPFYGGTKISELTGLDPGERQVTEEYGKKVLNALVRGKLSLENEEDSVLSELVVDRLAAGFDVITPRLIADEAITNMVRTKDASVSGTLTVDVIRANRIEGLEFDSGGFEFADKLSLLNLSQKELEQSMASLSAKLEKMEAINLLSFVNLATGSSDLVMVNNFAAYGTATLSEVSIMDTLSVGNNMIFGDGSINTIGQDLEIQPLRQGAINLLGGLIRFDASGMVNFANDVSFEKNVNVAGVLSAHTISSTELLLSQSEVKFISSTEVESTGSAGLVMLRANTDHIKVNNPRVTNESLIFITPKTRTLQPLFLLGQTAAEPGLSGVEGSFTVGVDAKAEKDIKFNYLIVN